MRLGKPLAVLAAAFTLVFGMAATAAAAPTGPDPGDQPGTLIVGGRDATQTYSYMGSLQRPNDGYPHYCGTTLISATWAVSAAHCTQEAASSYQIRFGSNDRTSGGQLVTVKRIVNHASYNPGNISQGYDISLLELNQAVTLTPAEIAASSPAPGTGVRLLGWGQTCPQQGCSTGAPRYLKELDTQVISDYNCGGFNASTDLCISATTSDTSCYGDSGGPALAGGKLVGATSRSGDTGTTCGTGNVIYTDVTAFRQWIEGYVGDPGDPGDPPPDECEDPAWSPNTWYPPGAVVSHESRVWQNQSYYWSYGDEPGNNWWGIWQDVGPC